MCVHKIVNNSHVYIHMYGSLHRWQTLGVWRETARTAFYNLCKNMCACICVCVYLSLQKTVYSQS